MHYETSNQRWGTHRRRMVGLFPAHLHHSNSHRSGHPDLRYSEIFPTWGPCMQGKELQTRMSLVYATWRRFWSPQRIPRRSTALFLEGAAVALSRFPPAHQFVCRCPYPMHARPAAADAPRHCVPAISATSSVSGEKGYRFAPGAARCVLGASTAFRAAGSVEAPQSPPPSLSPQSPPG